MLVLNVLLLGLASTADISPQVGSLSSLVGASAKIAPVTRGLSVDFTITSPSVVSVSGDELKTPSWTGSCKLAEDALTYADGKLSANLALNNGSGTSIQGVRFDFVSAIESYKAKKDDGTEEIRTRTQSVTFSSPCYFGDLADGESSVSIPSFASGIQFKPETVNVTVHAVVSGLTYHKQFVRPKNSLKGCGVVVDNNGDVIVGEANHKTLWKFSEDGEFKSELGTLPVEGREVSINTTNGDLLVGLYNSHNDARVTSDGTTTSAFAANLDQWPGIARFDSTGKLYLKTGTTITTFTDYVKSSSSTSKIGGFNLRASDPFDLANDQVLWVIASNNLLKVDVSFENATAAVKPGTGSLGELLPTSSPVLRYSPDGEIYISEEGISGKFLPRVSVFDSEGRFIRTFGQGGQKANTHVYLPGQFKSTLRDFAFGKNGQVYVTQYDATCGLNEYIKF